MLIQQRATDSVKALARSGAYFYKAQAAILYRSLEDDQELYSNILRRIDLKCSGTEIERQDRFIQLLVLVGFLAVVEHAESTHMDEHFFAFLDR